MRILSILFFLLAAVNAYSGSQYEDNPMDVTVNMEKLLDEYRVKATQSLPYFNEKLKEHRDKEYYVITRVYEGDFYEQVFVHVTAYVKGVYQGTIASEPMGRVKFTRGADIKVADAEVVDWTIVKPDGTEEGNLLGKMIDLIRAGKAAFIYEMTPVDGAYSDIKVVSVLNGMTKQEIIDVVPKDVIARVEKYATSVQKEKTPEDEKKSYSYAVVKFPGWEIME